MHVNASLVFLYLFAMTAVGITSSQADWVQLAQCAASLVLPNVSAQWLGCVTTSQAGGDKWLNVLYTLLLAWCCYTCLVIDIL